jgi:hypothetical protein
MLRRMVCVALGTVMALPVWADSLTASVMADDDHGQSFDLHGRFAPLEALTLGASAGHSKSRLQGSTEEFSATSYGVSVDVDAGPMFVTATADRWNDSGELRSTVLHGEVGWLSLTGLSVAALVTNRNMRVTYTSTALNQTRQRDIDFQGTGWGGDVSYFGMNWTTSARFLAYGYGHSVDRVRTVLESGNVDRFPRLQRLIGSVITRAAGAPDREASLTLGRQFDKSSVTADFQWTRDALTQEKTKSAGITLGLWPTARFGIDLSAGASNSNEAGTVAWAGLAFTLRRAK